MSVTYLTLNRRQVYEAPTSRYTALLDIRHLWNTWLHCLMNVLGY